MIRETGFRFPLRWMVTGLVSVAVLLLFGSCGAALEYPNTPVEPENEAPFQPPLPPPVEPTVDTSVEPPSRFLGECESPPEAWLWCDDFEIARDSSYFEYDDGDGSFVRAAEVGVDGSDGMRARFEPGQVAAGSMKLAFGRTPSSYVDPVDEGVANHTEIFWRLYLRFQPGWTGGGGDKLSRATSLVTENWAQSMIAHVWSGNGPSQNYLTLDPASGTLPGAASVVTTAYNDFAHLRWLGMIRGMTPIFEDAGAGKWYCIESRVKLNTPGLLDGAFDLWIDDRPEASGTGLDWRGSFAGYGINAIFLENYWNSGSPRRQERYFDHLVVSTERIGCLPTDPPSPEEGV